MVYITQHKQMSELQKYLDNNTMKQILSDITNNEKGKKKRYINTGDFGLVCIIARSKIHAIAKAIKYYNLYDDILDILKEMNVEDPCSIEPKEYVKNALINLYSDEECYGYLRKIKTI